MDRDLFLINRIKRGDEAAMEEFVRKYYGRIADYCRYHTFGDGDAESAAQDTFVKFFSSVASYGHRGKTLNYLYRIAGNVCNDMKRKAGRENAARDELMREVAAAMERKTRGSDMGMEDAEMRIDVARALEKLSPGIREVIVLFYFQDMRIRDISEVTGAGGSLVKYRLKRGRELLREMLDGARDVNGKEEAE